MHPAGHRLQPRGPPAMRQGGRALARRAREAPINHRRHEPPPCRRVLLQRVRVNQRRAATFGGDMAHRRCLLAERKRSGAPARRARRGRSNATTRLHRRRPQQAGAAIGRGRADVGAGGADAAWVLATSVSHCAFHWWSWKASNTTAADAGMGRWSRRCAIRPAFSRARAASRRRPRRSAGRAIRHGARWRHP